MIYNWTEVAPDGGALNRAWGSSAMSRNGKAIMVGAIGSYTLGGILGYLSKDKGITWVSIAGAPIIPESPLPIGGFDMSGDGKYMIYKPTSSNAFFLNKTMTSGDWEKILPSPETPLIAIVDMSINYFGSVMVAVMNDGVVKVSINYGVDWYSSSFPTNTFGFYRTCLSYTGSIIYFAAVTNNYSPYNNRVFVSYDYGNTYSATENIDNGYMNGINCSYDGVGVVCNGKAPVAEGSTGFRYISTNGGATWILFQKQFIYDIGKPACDKTMQNIALGYRPIRAQAVEVSGNFGATWSYNAPQSYPTMVGKSICMSENGYTTLYSSSTGFFLGDAGIPPITSSNTQCMWFN